MGHPALDNQTPFHCTPLVLADSEGRPILIPVVKATFQIGPDGKVELADEQVPLLAEGEYWGDPGEASMKYEPEVAPQKIGTDVVLIGHAYPDAPGATMTEVSLQLGPIQKRAKVFGDRRWVKRIGIATISKPEPFEKMPLLWERAFGGWDRSDPDPTQHSFDDRNPVGRGFCNRGSKNDESALLPNIENPKKLIAVPSDRPVPWGFGFVAPHWQPRAKLGGTYDQTWSDTRAPRLPLDFDPRFFNAAPPDQVVPEFLHGGEEVLLTNLGRPGNLTFALPSTGPLSSEVHLKRRGPQSLDLKLDTVIINLDENQLFLLWRASLVLPESPHDIAAIAICRSAVAIPS